jgi:hypothetical protein
MSRKGAFFKLKDTFSAYTLSLRIRNNYVCTVHCAEYDEDYCVHATALTRDFLK